MVVVSFRRWIRKVRITPCLWRRTYSHCWLLCRHSAFLRSDVYLDDVLLATPDIELHLEELRELLQAHRTAWLKLNMKKTDLFTESTDYLSYRISASGIELKKDYVEQILSWPIPDSPKALRRFIGFSSYYRDSVEKYTELTAAMNAVKNKRSLQWTKELDRDFKELKRCFVKYPVRSYPDFGPKPSPFILTTNYSKNA